MLRCLCEQFHLDGDKAGRRKLQLLACGLARTVWDLVPDGACKETIAMCERLADKRRNRMPLNRRWRHLQQLEEEGILGGSWCDLLKLRDALRADRWGRNGGLLYQAASEVRRVEAWRLKDAGASVEVQRSSTGELKQQHISLLRHIVGNPFRPYPAPSSWPASVVKLAEAMSAGEDCSFALHDALLEAGLPELAEHFREQDHPKGCWVLDVLLDKS
jgi:hypothetical protein